ncbi:MAG: cytidylate kinase [Candidatus Fraserbacteria bacterium RBG_16_55_9]|uniref:Cytidylate kinase n=1 Tax=Fraserbacteria sp. (strain RBG_16_55_9) TaxID=1817864 RepID=A0A1F5UPT2_FRAXR|nr:MAG: cytidylate kinase [Candidatus Fraserbacteria bacterium RBG_16_55_9]
MIIAIDGPAGAGKTTIGRALARYFRCKFINTGAMYRAVAWALQQGAQLEETELNVDEQGRLIVDGQVLHEDKLYRLELDEFASKIARRPEVRVKLIALQRELAKESNVVMEGRDIGTVVLPHADVKLYIDAPIRERARRRLHQRPRTSLEEILKELEDRDQRDQGFGRLSPAPDAVMLTTAGKTPEESIAQALQVVREALGRKTSMP